MKQVLSGSLAGLFSLAVYSADLQGDAPSYSTVNENLSKLKSIESHALQELHDDTLAQMQSLSAQYGFSVIPLKILKDSDYVTANARHCEIITSDNEINEASRTFVYALQDNFQSYKEDLKRKTGLFKAADYNVISLKQAPGLGGNPEEQTQLNETDICAFLPADLLGPIKVIKTRARYYNDEENKMEPITSNPPFIPYDNIPVELLDTNSETLIYQIADITDLPHEQISAYITKANIDPDFPGSACIITPLPSKWKLMKLDRDDMFHVPFLMHP